MPSPWPAGHAEQPHGVAREAPPEPAPPEAPGAPPEAPEAPAEAARAPPEPPRAPPEAPREARARADAPSSRQKAIGTTAREEALPDRTAVVFERREDGRSEEPLMVPKRCLVPGKACKHAFRRRQPGTALFTSDNLYVKGVMAVKMATRGKMIEGSSDIEEADAEPPPDVEDCGDTYASHFVRLHIDGNGKRTFDPPRLRVLAGEVVHFSWRSETKPLQLLETDREFNPEANVKEDGVQIVKGGERDCKVKIAQYTKGERIYFVADGYSEDARMQITVVAGWVVDARRIVRQVVPLVIAAVVMAALAFLAVDYIENMSVVEAFFDCQGKPDYCGGPMTALKKHIFSTAALPMCSAFGIIAIFIPKTIISMFWFAPTLCHYQQGFRYEVGFFLRVAGTGFLILPFAFVFADWIMISSYSWGVTDLFHTFGHFVQTILDDLLIVVTGTGKLLRVSSALESAGYGSPPDSSVLDAILEYESQVRGYTQLGVDLLATIVLVRLTLVFTSLLFVVVALSYGAAGLVRRSPAFLHKSSWLSIVSLALVLWSLGMSAFFHRLWLETYNTYLSVDGVVSMPAGGVQPLAVTLLSSCSDSLQAATIPVNALLAPLQAVLGSLGSALLVEFSDGSVITGEDVERFANEVEVQLGSLRHWMSQKDARTEEFGLDLLEGVTMEQFAEALEGGVLTAQVLADSVQCKQISPFLSVMQRLLDHDIYRRGVVYVEYVLAALLLLWSIFARITVYVLLRPHKIYHDRVARRWFRFKICYRVSVRLRKATVGNRYHAHRVKTHCWDRLRFLDGLLLLNTVTTTVLCTAGGMFLFLESHLSPTWQWVEAGAFLLIASSALGYAGAWRELGACRNKALRAAGVLAAAAATGCLAYSAADTVNRQLECIQKVRYDPSAVGPTAQTALTTTRAATESADGWNLDVTGQGLSDGDRLGLVRDGASCPQAEGASFDAQSTKTTSFGRRHHFQTTLESGTYGLCWCPSGGRCHRAENYKFFAGRLYVDEPVDKFDACTLEVMAGMSQSALAVAVILPFCVLRIVLGIATLFHCVYSAHITDRQRMVTRTLADENPSSASAFKTPRGQRTSSTSRRGGCGSDGAIGWSWRVRSPCSQPESSPWSSSRTSRATSATRLMVAISRRPWWRRPPFCSLARRAATCRRPPAVSGSTR
ncbi:unnamed protein product [Prorocentrum cordatum]|uniref:Uncharacterized protein n=1 Tax=Prorocentrum cordatum TaxID=2364126 RepID=A0ABN9TS22_9DINO|nr:unnamed protein product [Polarella glacialis]